MKFKILFIFLTFCICPFVNADSLNVTNFGNLFITNFSPDDYESFNQNWDICQGENGLMYIANGPLMEGGSDFWNTLFIGEQKYIRSVHPYRNGSILVGANGEIGLFKRSGIPGETHYTSLMSKLDPEFQDFGSVWQILDRDSTYYLRAGRALFTLQNDTIIPLIYDKIVDYICFINDEIYVLVSGEGLGTIRNSDFELLPYGNYFADKKIVSIIQLNNTEILIFTDDHGVFIADETGLKVSKKFNVPEIIQSQISKALYLNENYFAIGTVRNGLFILDRNAKIIQHVNKQSGLQNNTIISMYADESQNLWLGLDYGLSYVYLNSCISILNTDFDIGTGYVSRKFNDKLYLGTNQGLYYMDWENYKGSELGSIKIFPVENTSGQVWNLQIIDGVLFCSHHKGLYKIEDDKAELVSSQEGSWGIEELNSLPGYYFQSTYRGFFLYKYALDGRLELIRKLGEIEASRMYTQDAEGNIWTVTELNRLVRYQINPSTINVGDIKLFANGNEHDFERIRLVGNSKGIILNTDKGFFSVNPNNDEFQELAYYNELFSTKDIMAEFFEDDFERIWYVTENEIGYFSTKFGEMKKVSRPFSLVSRSYTIFLGRINIIDEGNVLFGVDKGFYHFNAFCSIMRSKDYSSYIIDLNTYSEPLNADRIKEEGRKPAYSHKKNSFDFSFASNIIESRERIQYRYKLEGYDEDWSDWSDRNTKEYSNLYEGAYTLKLIARDESGIESTESSFAFQVKPPPFRTIYAFLIYVVLFILLLLLLIRYRDKKVEKEKLKVEEEKYIELEDKKKKYEGEQLKSKQRITELVNDRLHQDLKHKSKELSNSMINILHKNEILLNLKQEMQDLYLEKNLGKRDYNIKKLINVIDREISTKKDLEVFDSNFNAVHEEFLKNLKEQFPNLNQNDHRLCTFIKMNKSTKEIATFLNLSIRGVETSRYRLRKKMGLDSDENLYDIITSI